jgi:hypothetical protein
VGREKQGCFSYEFTSHNLEVSVLALDVHNTDPRLLARMLDLDALNGRGWQPEELSAILRHQLAGPMEFELNNSSTVRRQGRRAVRRLRIRSFADLLHHPRPPLKLLQLTKEFAKASRNHPDSPLPDEVASLLYFASIVVARLRWGRRISDLDDVALGHGLRWGAEQAWVDDATRRLFREGLAFLSCREEELT